MLTLTEDEKVELTGKERPSAQRRVLTALGIPFRTRPDGTNIVLRSDVESTTAQPAAEPDFGALKPRGRKGRAA